VQSYAQEDNEKKVCNYITNLITNQYDEYGEIYLEANGWQAYIPDVRTMTQFQKYALSASVFLVAGLFVYSCYLYRFISQAKYSWHPRGNRGFSTEPGEGPSKMDRMHSGIIQGRSRSGRDFEVKNGGTYA
jgi:hypothetical protein